MKNFSVLSVFFEKGNEVSNPDFRSLDSYSFDSYSGAVDYFYYLVGFHTFLLGECTSRIPTTLDSSFIISLCVSNGSKSYYIYLQKNS